MIRDDVDVIDGDTTLAEAMARLWARGHRPLAVRAGKRVVGLLDGPAVAERLAAAALDVRTARVHDLRLPELICGWEGADVTEALTLLRATDITDLIVLDREGDLVGWVTREALATFESGHEA